MKTRADGRGLATVSPMTAAIVNGEADLSEWSDEELLRGQRRDRRGTWGGKPPNLVPAELHRELARRRMSQAYTVLRDSVVDAVKIFHEIATSEVYEPEIRLKAAREIVDRVMGRPHESVSVDLRGDGDFLAPWQRVVANAIVATTEEAKSLDRETQDGEVVEEGELVDEDEDEELLDDTLPPEPEPRKATVRVRIRKRASEKTERRVPYPRLEKGV